MELAEVNKKYIFLAIVGVMVVGIFAAKWMGTKQDEQFAYENELYNSVQQYLSSDQVEEAIPYLHELLETKPNVELVNYTAALVYSETGDMKLAALYMQKALDINPYRVDDAMFMLGFGEMLFFAERYEDAKTVLIQCQESGWAPEAYPDYQLRLEQLLAEIEAV